MIDPLSSLFVSNYGVFHRPTAQLIGLNVSILLSELLSKHQFIASNNALIDDPRFDYPLFYYPSIKLAERTCLSRHEIEGSIRLLLNLGFLSVHVIGVPATRHFCLHRDQILHVLSLPEDQAIALVSQAKLSKIIPHNAASANISPETISNPVSSQFPPSNLGPNAIIGQLPEISNLDTSRCTHKTVQNSRRSTSSFNGDKTRFSKKSELSPPTSSLRPDAVFSQTSMSVSGITPKEHDPAIHTVEQQHRSTKHITQPQPAHVPTHEGKREPGVAFAPGGGGFFSPPRREEPKQEQKGSLNQEPMGAQAADGSNSHSEGPRISRKDLADQRELGESKGQEEAFKDEIQLSNKRQCEEVGHENNPKSSNPSGLTPEDTSNSYSNPHPLSYNSPNDQTEGAAGKSKEGASKREIAKKSKIPDDRLLFGANVKLTLEQYETLCVQHGKGVIDKLVDEMNDYLLCYGKSYKDYAAAIRQWMRRRATSNLGSTQNGTVKQKIERAQYDRWVASNGDPDAKDQIVFA